MSSKRPVIHIEPEPFDKLLDRISLVFLLIQFLIPLLFYSSLGDTVPIRFDTSGEVSSTASRATIWILPVVGTLLFIMFYFLNKVPHTFNFPVKITPDNAEFHYRKSVRMMRYVNLICMVMFAYIIWSMAAIGSGAATGLRPFIMSLLTILLFLPIGHYLYVVWKKTPG
ncbi:MAG: DUF1648 domain-containing protein [Balneolia bacterium]|nr:DUF1648 domain-containing protein [Balneolia bacterium]